MNVMLYCRNIRHNVDLTVLSELSVYINVTVLTVISSTLMYINGILVAVCILHAILV